MPQPNKTGESDGVIGALMRVVGSFSRHVQALGALAGLEGREAVALYVRLLVMLGAALFFAAFGYVFVLLFLAFGIAVIFGVGWVWITLGLAALHLLLAFWCALHVRKHFGTPIFSATSEQIRRGFANLSGETATAAAAATQPAAHPLVARERSGI